MNKILISHEFPNAFYETGFTEDHTDYDYCLIHRYLDTPSYAEYMRNAVKKGRTVYLDNGVYELGSAFEWDDYVKVIEELKPTYYILPDIFNTLQENIDSQIAFYKLYDKEIFEKVGSLPIAIPHGRSLKDLLNSLKTLDEFLKEDTMFAIPFGSASFENKNLTNNLYFTSTDVPYVPARQALNRKKFVVDYLKDFPNRKFHLLGCKSICEFDNWDDLTKKDQIVSIDTSLPVAMSFEKISFREKISSENKAHYYKPVYLIDKHFNISLEELKNNNQLEFLEENISIFRNHVQTWHENY